MPVRWSCQRPPRGRGSRLPPRRLPGRPRPRARARRRRSAVMRRPERPASRRRTRLSPETERVEDPAVRGWDGLTRFARELFEQLTLLLGQLLRHLDIDHDMEIPARSGPPEVGHTLATQPDGRVRLRARLDLDLLLAIDRRHRDRRTERGLRDRDRRLVVKLRAGAAKRRMWRDVDYDVQRARRTAARPHLPLVGEPDLVALVDAGGDGHAQHPLRFDPAIAMTGRARALDDLALAPATRAGRDVDHLAEHRLANTSDLAPTFALRTGGRLGPGRGATAGAGFAAGE